MSGLVGPVFDPIAVLNATEAYNNHHLHEKYLGDAKQWVDVNTRNRELGQPLTPVPALPVQTIWVMGSDGNPVSHTEPFPDLVPPVLPPLLPQSPETPISTDGNTQYQLLLSIYKMLLDLLSRVPRA